MLAGIASYLRRHHVALLALFLALGGTSLAAASFINGKQIKPGSIPKNRLTASAIRSLKGNKGAQGVAGQRGPTGVQGPPGASATKLWAVVLNTGALARGSGVTASTRLFAGRYAVTFDQDITACSYQATVGNPGEGFSIGVTGVALQSGTTNAVWVATMNPLGTFTDENFHLAVFC